MGNHGVWADDEIHLASQQEYIIEGKESPCITLNGGQRPLD